LFSTIRCRRLRPALIYYGKIMAAAKDIFLAAVPDAILGYVCPSLSARHHMRIHSVSLIVLCAALICASAPARADVNWQGLYGGLQLGGGFGESRRDFTPPEGTTGTYGISGVTGGVTAGYNWQINNIVAGIEGDFSGSDVDGSHNCPATSHACETYSNWLGTVRPRVGYALGSVLPYVTGGLAVGDVGARSRDYTNGSTGSAFDNTEVGWTAGGGVEYAIPATPLSIKAEYLYVDLDNSEGPSNTGAPTYVKFHENIGRVGLNYRFN
jgi:outer membrane immunogenic protein